MSDWIDKLFDDMEGSVPDQVRDALFYSMSNCQYTEDEQVEWCYIIYSKQLTEVQVKNMFDIFGLNKRSFQEIDNPTQKQITEHIKLISYLRS